MLNVQRNSRFTTMSKNKKVDEYISQSKDFAKPILKHLRELIHVACPQVVETIKWGHPHFEYKGPLCNMAAFNKHCAFGFWKAALMKEAVLLKEKNVEAMSHSGKLKSLLDLPKNNIIIARVKEAVLLNEQGLNLSAKEHSGKKPEIAVPLLLKNNLQKNKKFSEQFDSLSRSHKKEYIEWVEDAKKDETKLNRIASIVKWVMEGKTRN
jgi:hypothetical protein